MTKQRQSSASPRVVNRVDREFKGQSKVEMYLDKLTDLVPYVPRNRKLSKLEVIQYVIEYICDLQDVLDIQHPVPSLVATENSTATASASSQPAVAAASRQPLGVIPPNTYADSLSLVNQPQLESEKSSSADNEMSTC
ncbi:DNA-binding protein inhibitor ID-2 [Cloeon dipterum]|uniref:DNA-binding protein inhibitor ID-2 n=1 Tax=Cloeon dipterum TaxID=197152 RepID=UPI00321F809D